MGQESPKRILHSARHNSCPKDRLNNSTRPDQSGKFESSNDMHQRPKSVNLESMDTREVGGHHIITLPSLSEPKGLVFNFKPCICIHIIFIIIHIICIITHYIYNYTYYIYNYTYVCVHACVHVCVTRIAKTCAY